MSLVQRPVEKAAAPGRPCVAGAHRGHGARCRSMARFSLRARCRCTNQSTQIGPNLVFDSFNARATWVGVGFANYLENLLRLCRCAKLDKQAQLFGIPSDRFCSLGKAPSAVHLF